MLSTSAQQQPHSPCHGNGSGAGGGPKRAALAFIFVTVLIDQTLGQADHEIERTASGEHSLHAPEIYVAPAVGYAPDDDDDFVDEIEEDEEDEDEDEDAASEAEDEDDGDDAPASEDGEGAEARDDADRRGRGRRNRRRRGGRRDEGELEAAADLPERELAEGETETEEEANQRRRRRGRRGGRRMRDDSRPQDGFSWTRPRVPFGDDPFVWHDPAVLAEGGGQAPLGIVHESRAFSPDHRRPLAGHGSCRRRIGPIPNFGIAA
jgi:ribonuclease E